MAIELTDELIELERAAWAEQQENRLTVETAARVQAAVATHTEATGRAGTPSSENSSGLYGTPSRTLADTPDARKRSLPRP